MKLLTEQPKEVARQRGMRLHSYKISNAGITSCDKTQNVWKKMF